MSHIGEQFHAPNGLGPLQKDRIYHWLGHHGAHKEKVLLVFFDEKPGAYLTSISRVFFEDAIETAALLPVPKASTLPPWLKLLEGRDLTVLQKRRGDAQSTYRQMVDKRLSQIQPLIDRAREILSLDAPDKEVNRFARTTVPALNEERARVWFFSYLAFGRDKWVLLPSFVNIGHWDRQREHSGKKFGRPSLSKGKLSGHAMTDLMRDAILEAYEQHRGLGVFMTTIYAEAMRKKFGCKVRTIDGKWGAKRKEFFHPSGSPFPSFWQFYRAVRTKFGLEAIQISCYGVTRVRTKNSASKGKFSEEVANLLERIEGDAYYVAEVPKGLNDGEPMPPLAVVRLRCVASGMLVGIGFSIGKERSEAYQMALFCMAIPKVLFCAMFGLPLRNDEWPCQGLPSWAVFDRGPGAANNLIREFEAHIAIRQLSPSYSGQSKATVESSHPRNVKTEGKPTFIQSDLNYVQLARREILRTIRDNQRTDISPRQTLTMVSDEFLPIPLNLWRYLDHRRRTDAHPISFDVAVRALLALVDFTADEDGVYLHGLRFDSDELRQTGLHDRVVAQGKVKVPGYVLSLSVRQAWVELNGRLIRVDARLPIRDNEGQLYTSLKELSDLDVIRSKQHSALREHRAAVDAEYREIFEEETGKKWDAGHRKTGRPKRGTTNARHEFTTTKNFTTGRRQKV